LGLRLFWEPQEALAAAESARLRADGAAAEARAALEVAKADLRGSEARARTALERGQLLAAALTSEAVPPTLA
jgi:hypothetical protein